MKCLSSIFSFETLETDSFSRSAIITPVVVFVLVVALEAAFFFLLPDGSVGDYWTPEVGFNHKIADTHLRDAERCILFLGDSTAKRDYSYPTLANHIPQDAIAWNLAADGNFPMSFVKVSLPLIEKYRPEQLVISFIPTGLAGSEVPTVSELSILSSPISNQDVSEWSLPDHILLTKLWRSLRQLRMDSGGIESQIRRNHGFEPCKGSVVGELEKNGGSMKLSSDRFSVIKKVMDVCSTIDCQLIVVVPPTLDDSLSRCSLTDEYLTSLLELSDRGELAVLDYSRGYFTVDEFADANHLNERGAIRLTEFVAASLVETGND